jgi:3-oxoacyl-[acyl-carrier protein] reductase
MSSVPEAALGGAPASIELHLSTDLVERFAALTGDWNRLHVDETFARRSSFRRPVVHGMLPLSFLPLLPQFRLEGFRSVLVGLSARFAVPVFIDTPVRLTVGSCRADGERPRVTFNYVVETTQDSRSTAVTSGTVTVAYEATTPGKTNTVVEPGSESACLVPAMERRHLLWDEIALGDADRLEFRVTEATIAEFLRLLQSGLVDTSHSTAQVADTFDVPTLLSILLYSTSLGVILPGGSATFLEFSAQADRPVEIDEQYTLQGRITHRSAATRIIRKELLVKRADNSDVAVRGKASTLVAAPSRRMPTVDELKETGVDFGLRDKVVLITGASRGIGETTAKLFALHGAKIVVNYRHGASDAQRVVDDIVEGGGDAVAIAADVSDPEQVRSLIQQARERFGTIDVLVNNAARDFRPTPFLRLTWEEMQRDLDVIVKGAFLCCQEVLPLMLARGAGKIINISTVATDNPPPDQTKYVVAKSALVGLTRSLSVEFASRNIHVNLVVPNFVETDMVAHVPEGFRRKIAQDIPMRRPAMPVEVARAVVFLASSYSSFTTGQKVMVTGGGPPYV